MRGEEGRREEGGRERRRGEGGGGGGETEGAFGELEHRRVPDR